MSQLTEERRQQLENAGFKEGTAAEFLGMSPAEEKQVEVLVAAHRYERELSDANFQLLKEAVLAFDALQTEAST